MKAKLRIQNFKQLKDVTVELKPLMMLFGTNGSGKSSLMKGMLFFSKNVVELFNFKKNGLKFISSPKTQYYFDDNINLASYDNIVFNRDKEKSIIFTFSLMGDLYNHRYSDWFVNLGSIDYEGEQIKIIGDLREIDIKYTERKLRNGRISKMFNEKDKKSFMEDKKNINIMELIKTLSESFRQVNFEIKTVFSRDKKNRNLKEIIINDKSLDLTFTIQQDDKRGSQITYKNNSSVELEINSEFLIGFIKDFLQKGSCLNIEEIGYDYGRSSLGKYTKAIKDYYDEINEELNPSLEAESTTFNLSEIDLLYHAYISAKIIDLFPSLLYLFTGIHHYLPSYRENPPLQLEESKLQSQKSAGVVFNYKELLSYLEFEEWREQENGLSLIGQNVDLFNSMINMFDFKELRVKEEHNIYKIYVTLKNGTTIDLYNTSSGFIQIFPLLFLLFYQPDEIKKILIEQPELHLHPKLQSKVIETIVDFIFTQDYTMLDDRSTVSIVIETHSEHMVRKLQVMVAKGQIPKDDISVYYFNNKEGNVKIKEMEFDKYGFFKEPWPDGFFDDSSNLAWELLQGQSERKN